MAMMKRGSDGSDVRRLQERLGAVGFNPGAIDGDFGPATEAAVRAFQASEALLVDGIAGPQTLEALDVDVGPEPPWEIERVTVSVVGQAFPGTPPANIEANLPFVLTELVEPGLGDKPMVLMAMATIRAETAQFLPIDEGVHRFNTSPGGHPFDLYDNRKDLGNLGPPDGAMFKGRGHVQLTGRDNYRRIGTHIGRELVNNPALANNPDIAARILAAFLKTRERSIREALLDHDLKAARRLVNGGSHGITRFTKCYRALDRLIA